MPHARTKLINLLVAIRRLAPLSELSGDEERLLFELYAAAQETDTILVTDVFNIAHNKSRSSAYRTLIALREKGIVAFEEADLDRRKRHVRFTPRAEAIFKSFS